MSPFTARIEIIGVNPYVEVPHHVLQILFKTVGREKGPIPVKVLINNHPFIQTLIKYRGLWRLYLNTPMRKATKTNVGDTVTVTVEYDPAPRIISMPKLFEKALDENPQAKENFSKLPPSRQKEINRYLGFIKNEEVLKKNIAKTVQYLLGKKVQGVLYR